MGIRNQFIALAVAVGLLAIYGFFAIFLQPLGSSGEEALNRAPGQTTVIDEWAQGNVLSDGRAPLLLLSYVDGAEATLVKGLYNSGPTPLTITGVETFPPGWVGLVTFKDVRSAVVVGPAPCCQLNEVATWSAHEFRPIQVNPGEEGVIAMHLLMSNCEHSPSAGYLTIESIKVDYSLLGFPHSQSVDVGPYAFRSPDSCPRP
jgi:hypothetical protein